MDGSEDSARRDEAELLAEIGRHLFDQNLRVKVRLPAELAARAIAGWHREDIGGAEDESPAERDTRHQAGALALIGLAIEERSNRDEDDHVTVELDAWQIGMALDAAEQRGMLEGVRPPDQEV